MPTALPENVITRDRELDGRATRASEELARLRWHWTLDESNPNKVTLRQYAAAIGHSTHKTVGRYANGYALFVERGSREGPALTIQDAIRLSEVAEEDRSMHEAIAEGSGRPVSQVSRGDNRHRTRATIERAKSRAERRGGDPVDHARDIAAEERKVAEAKKRRKATERERRSSKFIRIEGHLANAQRRLMDALHQAEGVDFPDDEMELIRSSLANIRAVLNLIDLRMAGTPDIDWDAELAQLGGAS